MGEDVASRRPGMGCFMHIPECSIYRRPLGTTGPVLGDGTISLVTPISGGHSHTKVQVTRPDSGRLQGTHSV